jgi:hypothetical protein
MQAKSDGFGVHVSSRPRLPYTAFGLPCYETRIIPLG